MGCSESRDCKLKVRIFTVFIVTDFVLLLLYESVNHLNITKIEHEACLV